MGVCYTIALHNSVRECMDYISNPRKIIPQESTMRLLTYMQSHAAESAVSVGCNGCYGAEEIALKQFRACERLYHETHNARERGIVGEHLIFSLAPNEKANLGEIIRELMRLPVLRDFYAYGTTHYNTDKLHIHLVICNYAKDGSRKLCMNKTKRYYLKNELDHICVRHGLSIIDEPILQIKYPERERWIEALVRAGTVRVLLPANALQIKHPNRHLQWMIGQYRAGRVGICEGESVHGKFKRPTKRAKQIAIYAARKAKAEAYTIRTPGRNLSLDNQIRRAQSQKEQEIQSLLDTLDICRELNVANVVQLDTRIKEIDTAIRRTERALAYQRRNAGEELPGCGTEYGERKRKKAAGRVAALEKKRQTLRHQYQEALAARRSIELQRYKRVRGRTVTR